MEINALNIKEKSKAIKELHAYKQIAAMNDYEFKLVKAKRSFIWHKHPETDEVFICIEGGFDIELRDKTLSLREGDMVVIPKGVEHRPVCKDLCTIMLIEPKGTVNTGDAGGNLTDTKVEAI
ncbi:MAG: cupin domain-containing protein [Desulfobacterales bacterium]|nr:cupin domain-containing protein [Desulfobacterales bacterium]